MSIKKYVSAVAHKKEFSLLVNFFLGFIIAFDFGYGLLISWWSIIIDFMWCSFKYSIASFEVDPQSTSITNFGFFRINFWKSFLLAP